MGKNAPLKSGFLLPSKAKEKSVAADVDELAEELASSSLAASQQQERRPLPQQRPTTLDDLPNDLLVSIFEEVGDLWARETFPLVCRRWRDLYRTRQASPLHEFLVVDLERDLARGPLAWARVHAQDVRTLCVPKLSPNARIRDFTEETFAELVSVVGPRLTQVDIASGCGSLLRGRFWETLRVAVVPRCRLRLLNVDGIRAPIADGFASRLGELTSLERLSLSCEFERRNQAPRGLSGFPASLVALSRLTYLRLENHRRVVSLPSRISSLGSFRMLNLTDCSLRALPAELGALTGLQYLHVGGNEGLGADATAFPAALRGLTSLVTIGIDNCRLRSVPSFVGSLTSLERILMGGNVGLGSSGAPHYGFPASVLKMTALTLLSLTNCGLSSVPPAVLSSMPRLKELKIGANRLTELPRDFGKRLTELADLDLQCNRFTAVPAEALAGATALEEIKLFGNEDLQVEQPLDSLLERLPRLRVLRVGKRGPARWSPNSKKHLPAFAAKLKERNPDAPRVLLEPLPAELPPLDFLLQRYLL